MFSLSSITIGAFIVFAAITIIYHIRARSLYNYIKRKYPGELHSVEVLLHLGIDPGIGAKRFGQNSDLKQLENNIRADRLLSNDNFVIAQVGAFGKLNALQTFFCLVFVVSLIASALSIQP